MQKLEEYGTASEIDLISRPSQGIGRGFPACHRSMAGCLYGLDGRDVLPLAIGLACPCNAIESCYYTIMNRAAFIARLTEIQRTVEQLLAQLQTSEHDAFAAHLYQSRWEYRSVCQPAGKGGKQIERCIISSFQIAESMGFKGDFRQWEHLMRVGD